MPVARVSRVLKTICLPLALAAAPPAFASPLDEVMKTIFTVHSADDQDRFLGSAFLWHDGSVAVSNAHVVDTEKVVRLTDQDGNQEIGRVLARDPVRDLAVVAVHPGRPGLREGQRPVLGQDVWAVGAPLGVAFTVTHGAISALDRQIQPAVPIRMVQHDAAVNPGSSGGPLVDAEGHLLGVNSQIPDDSRTFVGISYAIPAADTERVVAGLLDETLPPFPHLGLKARAIDRRIAQALSIPAEGLLVDAVEDGGIAWRGGLLPGDVILSVNDTRLLHPGDLPFLIEAAQDQGEAAFEVLRDGATQTVAVPLQVDASGPDQRTVSHRAPERSFSFQMLGLQMTDSGVVATLAPESAAYNSGMVTGDRILALNGHAMDTSDLRDVRIDAPALLLVASPDGATRHVLVDPWGGDHGFRPAAGAGGVDPGLVVF